VRPPLTKINEQQRTLTNSIAPPPTDIPYPITVREAQIWPWLFAALLLLTTTGVWTQKDDWLDNRLLRGMLHNLAIPLENREKDWLITPESVRIQWVVRDDKSRVLVVSGNIRNLLANSMPLPEIKASIFSNLQPDQIVKEVILPITETPDVKAIAHTPYLLPQQLQKADAHSEHLFILFMESLPEDIGDLTLSPHFPRN